MSSKKKKNPDAHGPTFMTFEQLYEELQQKEAAEKKLLRGRSRPPTLINLPSSEDIRKRTNSEASVSSISSVEMREEQMEKQFQKLHKKVEREAREAVDKFAAELKKTGLSRSLQRKALGRYEVQALKPGIRDQVKLQQTDGDHDLVPSEPGSATILEKRSRRSKLANNFSLKLYGAGHSKFPIVSGRT